MLDYIILILIGLWVVVGAWYWFKCLIYILKDFKKGGSNEDI